MIKICYQFLIITYNVNVKMLIGFVYAKFMTCV